MIPIRLTLQGLYSYQEKQTIYFNSLTRAGIFGIFGAVGSGKSTLLEAITFALYGKTERLNLSGDNRNYNMMNLKSDELYLEFEFKTGFPFQDYLVLVRGKRNSKKFDEVKTLERTAYIKKSETWEPIDVDLLETVLGLSYENFKRTIIIPQGRFQEFLQLGAKDRSQMMKELFHLQKFELSPQVALLEAKNDTQLNQIIGMIQGLDDVTEEFILQKETEFRYEMEQLNYLKSELDILQVKFQEMNRLKELNDALSLMKETQKKLENKKEEMELLSKQIEEFEFCKLHFEPILKSMDEKKLRISGFDLELKLYHTEKKEAGEQLKRIQHELVVLKPQFENQNLERKKIEELGKILRIKTLEIEQLQLNKRIVKGESTLADLKNAKEVQTEQLNQIQNKLKTLKKNRPDVSELNAAKEWYLIDNQLKKDLLSVEKKITGFEEERKLLHLEKLTNQAFFPNLIINEIEPTDVWIQKLTEHLASCEKDYNQIESEMEQLSVQTRLNNFAKQLTEGTPCPLCGSEHHPSPLNSNYTESELEKVKVKKIKINEQRTLYQNSLLTFKELRIKELSNENRNLENTQKQKELLLEIQNHKMNFIWQKYLTNEQLNQAFNLLIDLNTQIESNEKQTETLQLEIKQSIEKQERYQLILDEIKKEKLGIDREIDILQNQIQNLPKIEWVTLSEIEIKNSIHQMEQQLRGIETLFKEMTTQEAEFSKKTEQFSNFIEKRTLDLKNEQSLYEQEQKEFEARLNQSAFKTWEQVQQVLNDSKLKTDDKKEIEEYRKNRAILLQKIADTQQSMGDAIYNPSQHLFLQEDFTSKNSLYTEKSKQTIQIEHLINGLRQEFEKKKKLNLQKNDLELRAQRLKTLKQLFNGSKFVNYVSTVHLQNLCRQANERFFKLSGQKLSLEIADDNSFLVRDYLNNGKIRHVKTLSGGQTFQAALSLALALADNIHKNTGTNENFFFLDEGFGSLDKNSLQLVFDSLKSLRKENRMVGIISHVEELQQEIDTYIYVTNTDEKGSIIHSEN